MRSHYTTNNPSLLQVLNTIQNMKKYFIIILCTILGMSFFSCSDTKEGTETPQQKKPDSLLTLQEKIIGKWETNIVNKYKDGVLSSTNNLAKDRIFSLNFMDDKTLINTNLTQSQRFEYTISDSTLHYYNTEDIEILKINYIDSDSMKLIFDYNDGDFDEYIFVRTK